MAYNLASDRRSLSKPVALQLVVDAASAAYKCGRKINERSRTNAQIEALETLGKKFARIANCAKRARASLRHELDHAVVDILRHYPIDRETIEALFDSVDRIFETNRDQEPARTALVALGSWDDGEIRKIPLKIDYEALPSLSQHGIETRLSKLLSATNTSLTAAEVFYAIAAVLGTEPGEVHPEIAPLMVSYVADLAGQWRSAGLAPGRAHDANNSTYRGRFHRFAEYALTAMVDPGTRRHDSADEIENYKNAVRKNYRELPKEVQRVARRGLRRSDWEWLISDDHLRKALAETTKKITPATP